MFVKLDETRALPGAFVQIYLQLLKRTSGQVRIMFLFNLISLITNQMMQFIRTCHTLYLGCSDIVIIFDMTSWLLFYVMTDTWLYTIICTTESLLKNNWEHWDSVLMVINYSMTCILKGKEKALL